MTVAVIFVPAAAHLATYASNCLDYCAARGYEVAGVVTADWAAAAAMVLSNKAAVLVVSSAEHLDPNREPRVEVVAEHTAPATPRHERTRMVRRNAAR